MINEDLSNLIDKYNKFFNDKLHPNMQFPGNQFGFRFYLIAPEKWVKIKKSEVTKKGIQCIKEYIGGKDVAPVMQTVTETNMQRYFVDGYTWDEFFGDLVSARKDIMELRYQIQQTKTSATSAVQNMVNSNNDTRVKDFDLFTNPKFTNKYTKADDHFLFDRLWKDKNGNIYIQLDNSIYAVEFAPGFERKMLGNTIDVNTNFWPAFFRQFKDEIEDWNKKITVCVDEFDWQTSNKSIEEAFMDAGVPRLYLESLRLQIIQEGVTDSEGKKHWYYQGTNVLPNAHSKSWTTGSMIEAFSNTLMVPVDVTRLKHIKMYSNDPDEVAIKYIERPMAMKHDEMPTLPKTWDLFLNNGRFYDPLMDKLKIAHFIDNTLNADYTGRQVLVLGGQGQDGKGVFMHVLEDIIGVSHCVYCTPLDFKTEDRFGLQKVINKKLVCLTDCKRVSALFAEDKFKALSGGDPLSIDRKNMTCMTWTPQGLTIAVATNKPFYVSDEHGRTRAMPAVFLRNFDENSIIERGELIRMLKAEKTEFLQWCVDYKLWMTEKHPGLFNSNILTMCTDEDIDRTDLNQFDKFKNMCEKQQLNGSKFCNWNAFTEEEESLQEIAEETYNEHLSPVIDKMIEVKGFIHAKDLVEKMNTIVVDDDSPLNRMMVMTFGKKKYDQISLTGKDKIYQSIRIWLEHTDRYEFSKLKRINGKPERSVITKGSGWEPGPDLFRKSSLPGIPFDEARFNNSRVPKLTVPEDDDDSNPYLTGDDRKYLEELENRSAMEKRNDFDFD